MTDLWRKDETYKSLQIAKCGRRRERERAEPTGGGRQSTAGERLGLRWREAISGLMRDGGEKSEG